MEIKTITIYRIAIFWMLLITLLVFLPGISSIVTTPIVVAGIILIPGILLVLNLNLSLETLSEYFSYSTTIGLSFLILGGVAINFIFPYIGIAAPLARLPLVIFLDLSVLSLLVRLYFSSKENIVVKRNERVNNISLFFGLLPILFVVGSVAGAERLNNGTTGTLTLCMLFAIAIYVIAVTIKRRSVQSWVYVTAIYLISLSLLLMYSLRSNHILGWDINQEYQVFQTTLQHLVWKMSYYPGLDYNACVSITILPTMFKELTHMPSEYVFKFIFQLLFATTPVMVYVLAKRYLSTILAFLAAFLFLSQTWFFEQMPALIRQETAFIFYIGILLVLFNDRLTSRMRYLLFGLLGVALILSHYSTAYIWLAVLGGTFIGSYFLRFFLNQPSNRTIAIKPFFILLPLTIVIIWQVCITHSIGTAVNFATNNNEKPISQITKNTISTVPILQPIIPSTPASKQSVIMKALFSNNTSNTDQNILLAEKKGLTIRALAGYNVYPDATTSGYIPKAINVDMDTQPKLPYIVSFFITIFTRVTKIVMIDLLPLIGIIVLYIEARRTASNKKYTFIILGIVCYGLLALVAFIPYLQQYYNFTRLYLQMFFVLSIFAVVGGAAIVKKYLPKYQIITLAVIMVLVFCSLTGAFDELTGGQARITLNQPPSTLSIFYTYDTEVAGVQWFAAHRNTSTQIESDPAADLRLEAFGNMAAIQILIFPQTIETDSYLYVDTTNSETGTGYVLYKNGIFTYNYPNDFINSHKNLIYNNGGSELFR